MEDNLVVLKQEYKKTFGKVFENSFEKGLKKAKDYAGKNGFIASLPQLIDYRINEADDNIWKGYSTSSEEYIGKTKEGNPVVIIVHGGGIFGENPKKITRAMNNALKGENAYVTENIPLDKKEFEDMVDGRLPNGTEIPLYDFGEYSNVKNLPIRHGIIIDYEKVYETTQQGLYLSLEEAVNVPLFVARCGGLERTKLYFEKIKKVFGKKSEEVQNEHEYNKKNPDKILSSTECSLPKGYLLRLDSSPGSFYHLGVTLKDLGNLSMEGTEEDMFSEKYAPGVRFLASNQESFQ